MAQDQVERGAQVDLLRAQCAQAPFPYQGRGVAFRQEAEEAASQDQDGDGFDLRGQGELAVVAMTSPLLAMLFSAIGFLLLTFASNLYLTTLTLVITEAASALFLIGRFSSVNGCATGSCWEPCCSLRG